MSFDLNLARGVITVLWCTLFIAIACTAWGRRRRPEFEAAAREPLDDLDGPLSGR